MKPLTYKDAGVDIDAGNDLVNRIKPLVKRTQRPEVLAGLGGFGGLFALWDYYFRITDPGHVRYYTPSAVLRLLQRAGFVDGRQLDRFQQLLSGGKLLASAVFLNARRD